MKKPKISVIIPAWNVEEYIGDCIESLKKQSLEDFEAIIIDDGSSDKTFEKAEHAIDGDKRFVLIKQKNAGVSAARNHALDLAKGEFITFLDSDDLVGESFLTKLYNASKSGAEIIVSPIITFSRDAKSEKLSDVEKILSPVKSIKALLYGKSEAFWGGPGAKLYAHSLINDLRFREDLKYSEDVDFFYKALLKCEKVSVLDYAGYFYRVRPGSATQAGYKQGFMQYRFEKAKEDLPKEIERAWNTNIAFNMIYYISLMDYKKDAKDYQKAKKLLLATRKKAVFDHEERFDQKLIILSSYIGPKFAAWGLKTATKLRNK